MAGSIFARSRANVLGAAAVAAALLCCASAAQAQQPDALATCRTIVAAADRAVPPGQRPVAGADYVPGVDVRGNPVAPADLNAQENFLPAEIVLPVQPDVFTFLGRTPPRGLDGLRAQVGELRIRLADGQMTFNGQPLGAVNADLIAACRELLATPPETPR